MTLDMGSKIDQVRQWLQELYGEEPVPQFEPNDTTVTYLHQLCVLSRNTDKNIQLMIDDTNQKCQEYSAEAQRLSSVLDRQSLSPAYLSQAGNASVATLAKLAELLQIKNASETNYYLAMQQLDSDLNQVEKKQEMEESRLRELRDKSHRATVRLESLHRTAELVNQKAKEEKSYIEKRTEITHLLTAKARECAKDFKKQGAGRERVDHSLEHENLVQKSQNLAKLKAELKPLKQEVQSYMALPPNLTETKIMIEQKKRELNALEKEMALCVDLTLT